MTIIVLMIVFCNLGHSQEVDDVRLTYVIGPKTLPTILKELASKSKVSITFSSNYKSKKKTSINARDEKLGAILTEVLRPYRMTYEVVGENIVIVPRRTAERYGNYTISGYVKDELSGEVLPYATVYIPYSRFAVNANENGYYSLELPRKQYNVLSSYIGYTIDTVRFFLRKDTIVDFALKEGNELETIIVNSNRTDKLEGDNVGKDYYSDQSIKSLAHLGGESDILRSVAMSAGVSTGADGFGGLSVRGGTTDQNQVLFDGVPMQQTGHALGLISIFNSDVISDARLIKGHFSPRYGGRLSSVLDIKTREGNYKKLSGDVSLSGLSMKAVLDGPIIKDKASFIIGYRRTYADSWISELSRLRAESANGEGSTRFFFSDINAKVNFKIGEKSRLFLNYYAGQDDMENEFSRRSRVESQDVFDQEINELVWKNNLWALHFHSELSQKVFTRVTLYTTGWLNEYYDFDRYYRADSTQVDDIYNSFVKSTDQENFGAKVDLDYQVTRDLYFKGGLGYISQSLVPQLNTKNNLTGEAIFPNIITKQDLKSEFGFNRFESAELYGYGELLYDLGSGVESSLGLRVVNYNLDSYNRVLLEPRVSINVDGDFSAFSLGISRMNQNLMTISNNSLGLPSEVFIAATENTGITSSWQFDTGFLLNTNGKGLIFETNFFAKSFSNLLSLAEGAVVPIGERDNWDAFIPKGKGFAYGGEVSFSKKYGRSNFDLNYTYTRSNRNFLDLNNAQDFQYRFNSPHNVSARFMQAITENIGINLAFSYATGSAISLPTREVLELENNEGERFLSIVYDAKNNFRLADYMRLDIGFDFKNEYSWGRQNFFIGVYNALNRKNPLYIDVRRNEGDANKFDLVQVNLFPLLPAINYSLSF